MSVSPVDAAARLTETDFAATVARLIQEAESHDGKAAHASVSALFAHNTALASLLAVREAELERLRQLVVTAYRGDELTNSWRCDELLNGAKPKFEKVITEPGVSSGSSPDVADAKEETT